MGHSSIGLMGFRGGAIQRREVSILETMQLISSSKKPVRMILELSDGTCSKKHYSESFEEALKKTQDFFYCIGRAEEMSIAYRNVKRGTYETFQKMGFGVHRMRIGSLRHGRKDKVYSYQFTYFTR